ncbi:hypothetical protein [Aequorivita capsosiphonis]|uniref:hypothetical protein n=1 Tax=Aequorivita capsosiphonis TaxID=487317 RepID=UPI000478A650|nr:hypothetical protein [Aequorivita capsosiphonis]
MLQNKLWVLFLTKTESDITRTFLLMAGENNSLFEDGQLTGAALDVFNDERLPKYHPFWKTFSCQPSEALTQLPVKNIILILD